MENSLFKRLWACHKAYYGVNDHDLNKTSLSMSRFGASGRRSDSGAGIYWSIKVIFAPFIHLRRYTILVTESVVK